MFSFLKSPARADRPASRRARASFSPTLDRLPGRIAPTLFVPPPEILLPPPTMDYGSGTPIMDCTPLPEVVIPLSQVNIALQ